ncbi:MAG TPA: hypothetical protein VHV75_14275 [Solirubrobacteraceae bacterium]|nr:hypothetical protein [Solirubrobacteraceae bacterium]
MDKRDNICRRKVTLVFEPDDVRAGLGENQYVLTQPRNRIEVDGKTVGDTHITASFGRLGTFLSTSLVEQEYAEPGTQVTVVWGAHPGPGTAPDADLDFPRIRATAEKAVRSRCAGSISGVTQVDRWPTARRGYGSTKQVQDPGR